MQEYKTSDISLASAIVSAGAEIKEVKKIGYSQCEFTLQGYDIDGQVMQFQNRNLKVDAMTLFENYKSLKARTNDVMRNTY